MQTIENDNSVHKKVIGCENIRDVPKPKNQFRPKPKICFLNLPIPKLKPKKYKINENTLNTFYLLSKILKV